MTFTFDELERYLVRRGANRDTIHYTNGTRKLLTDGEIARWTGLDRRTILRNRQRGHIFPTTADRIADNLGVTGGEIWTNYWDVIIAREEDRSERIRRHSQRALTDNARAYRNQWKRWKRNPDRHPHPSALRCTPSTPQACPRTMAS